MPEVSIIIPAYNGAKTISETLHSLQQQTFQDFEIIIINDGSTDNTLEIIESVQDPRIKIFSYSNGGLPTARNRGIAQAQGDFLTFIDADDLWTPDKMELQLTALKGNPNAGVAYSWTCFMDVNEQGQPIAYLPSPQYAYSGNVYPQLLIGDFILSGSNVMIRRSAVEAAGKFEPTLKSCEDWDYWLRLAACYPFEVIPKYQILYRRTPKSMSSKVEVMKEAATIAMERAYKAAPPELQYLKKYTLTNFHTYCASLYLQHRTDHRSIQEVQHHLWSAMRLYPKTFLEKTNQKIVLKFLLKRFLPSQISNSFIKFLKKPVAITDPRLQA